MRSTNGSQLKALLMQIKILELGPHFKFCTFIALGEAFPLGVRDVLFMSYSVHNKKQITHNKLEIVKSVTAVCLTSLTSK